MEKISILPVGNHTEAPSLANGRVMSREGGEYFVLTEAGAVVAARKADGCLLGPEVNDLVLITHGGRAGGFILSVLIKAGNASELTIPGTVCLKAHELTLSANLRAEIQAPRVGLEGISGEMKFLGLTVQAVDLKTDVDQAEVTGRRVTVTLDRLMQRVRNSFRWVKHLDQIKAGRISRIVKERFSVRAENVSLRAEKEVVVDADQINLG